MAKVISHFEIGSTQTWLVINDDGTVTLRIGTLRSSKAQTLPAAEAKNRWPTLAREIEAAVREIRGEPMSALPMARSHQS